VINHCVLLGRLGADPELTYTPAGTALCKFRLAVQRDKETTDWFSIVAWKATAENCAQYLHKGSLVVLQGRLQENSWETKSGDKRSRVEINAWQVEFLDKPAEEKKPKPQATDDEFADIPEDEDIFADEPPKGVTSDE